LQHLKKNEQILLRYRSENIIPSSRAGSALKRRLLLYKKQKTKNRAFFLLVVFVDAPKKIIALEIKLKRVS
jgi:hypothetical protein